MDTTASKTSNKKRKENGDEEFSLCAGHEKEDGLAHELMAIKSVMKELLDHSHSQMASIQDEMKSMNAEMKGMRNDVKNARDKCDAMEKLMQQTQHANSRLKKKDTNFRDRMESRFDDVENKQRYHEVLLKNQIWKYSAPLPDGDSDLHPRSRRFLGQIERETCNMRHGTCDGTISIRASGPYDATSFLPHWKEFANALQEYHYALKCLPKETSSILNFSGVALPPEVLDLLSNALEFTHFKIFILARNNHGRDGIKFALEYFQNNPILEDFSLVQTQITDEDDVHQLCEIIKEHPSIDTLKVVSCCGEGMNGYDMLCSIMTCGESKLRHIDFWQNYVRTGGRTFISDFLARNPILQMLTLVDNQLDDKDAISIASALRSNTNLRYINLEDNLITHVGFEALRKVVFDNSSLNAAAETNHTCAIHYTVYPGDERLELEINGLVNFAESGDFFEPKALRGKKIYSVLSSRNRECSNVHYFNDAPVEFLPDMFGAIQQYSEYHLQDNSPWQDDDDVNALSIVFEIVRRW
eukprot:CAMPEP_0201947038 /NCGR_PEP_ID=MMETSP0903-20130614/54733_1 /ASSEMBLY_ACC=CAM_ASM_000552 /TAXON_ID=420261 /ORGANISM="Thalassiosira antarctica, Strain CCMP982" /LENGTH=526 /DNA_ID=CAMNT_0048490159 /DNA_START=164 /DNA_END=1741 /DNA_ORIENTATION=-